MSVKIQPIGDRVLVKMVEDAEQIKGGIIIPDSAKEKPQEAEVEIEVIEEPTEISEEIENADTENTSTASIEE